MSGPESGLEFGPDSRISPQLGQNPALNLGRNPAHSIIISSWGPESGLKSGPESGLEFGPESGPDYTESGLKSGPESGLKSGPESVPKIKHPANSGPESGPKSGPASGPNLGRNPAPDLGRNPAPNFNIRPRHAGIRAQLRTGSSASLGASSCPRSAPELVLRNKTNPNSLRILGPRS